MWEVRVEVTVLGEKRGESCSLMPFPRWKLGVSAAISYNWAYSHLRGKISILDTMQPQSIVYSLPVCFSRKIKTSGNVAMDHFCLI